jgi:hypothetical protein
MEEFYNSARGRAMAPPPNFRIAGVTGQSPDASVSLFLLLGSVPMGVRKRRYERPQSESALNGLSIEVFDPGPAVKLSRGHHLRVQAAKTSGEFEHAAGRRALVQVVRQTASRRRPRSGKRQHSLTL